MKLFRVTVTLEVEADDRDHALTVAQNECSQSAFVTCESVSEIPDFKVCDADGKPVSECEGAACKSHGRCCWQG